MMIMTYHRISLPFHFIITSYRTVLYHNHRSLKCDQICPKIPQLTLTVPQKPTRSLSPLDDELSNANRGIDDKAEMKNQCRCMVHGDVSVTHRHNEASLPCQKDTKNDTAFKECVFLVYTVLSFFFFYRFSCY